MAADCLEYWACLLPPCFCSSVAERLGARGYTDTRSPSPRALAH